MNKEKARVIIPTMKSRRKYLKENPPHHLGKIINGDEYYKKMYLDVYKKFKATCWWANILPKIYNKYTSLSSLATMRFNAGMKGGIEAFIVLENLREKQTEYLKRKKEIKKRSKNPLPIYKYVSIQELNEKLKNPLKEATQKLKIFYENMNTLRLSRKKISINFVKNKFNYSGVFIPRYGIRT